MPLIDRFGREHTYLRVSVTDRCNLRCTYCMPADGVTWRPRSEILSLEEIHRVCRIAVSAGITKIRLTGGEPTVRQNLIELVQRLAALPGLKTLAMTTNGVTLAAQVAALHQAGLRSLNISLDTLRPQRFREITLHDRLHDVLRGIDAALDIGFSPLKLNVVVLAGINDDEPADFIEFIRHRPLNVRFIEFMPFPGNPWQENRYVPSRTIHAALSRQYNLVPAGSNSGVARDYRISGIAGTVSFIAPLTDEFCASCNRLRLTADGAVKSCLLYPAELSLRDALRSGAADADIAALIRNALAHKERSHPPECALPHLENRCMTNIGG